MAYWSHYLPVTPQIAGSSLALLGLFRFQRNEMGFFRSQVNAGVGREFGKKGGLIENHRVSMIFSQR